MSQFPSQNSGDVDRPDGVHALPDGEPRRQTAGLFFEQLEPRSYSETGRVVDRLLDSSSNPNVRSRRRHLIAYPRPNRNAYPRRTLGPFVPDVAEDCCTYLRGAVNDPTAARALYMPKFRAHERPREQGSEANENSHRNTGFHANFAAPGDGATGDGATGDGATGDGATVDGAAVDGAARSKATGSRAPGSRAPGSRATSLSPEAIDRELTRLARADGALRIAFGDTCAHLTAKRYHAHRGFLRLEDYARERLRMSPRTMQEASRVARRLRTLPVTRAQLEAGCLSWSAARAIARVATPKDEHEWLAFAGRESAQQLAKRVAAHAAASKGEVPASRDLSSNRDASSDPEPSSGHNTVSKESIPSVLARESTPPFANHATVADACEAASQEASDDEFADLVDGELRARVSIRCPRSTVTLWDWAKDLTSRMQGGLVPGWKTLELLSAEALAAAPTYADRIALADPVTTTVGTSSGEKESSLIADSPVTPSATKTYRFETRPSDRHERTLQLHIRRLSARIENLPGRVVEERLHELRRIEKTIDARVAFFLALLAKDKRYKQLGFSSLAHYARERMGFSPSRANRLVSIKRRLPACAIELQNEFRAGNLSTLVTEALIPVTMVGTSSPETCAAWIRRARVVTLARLEREVAWALGQLDETNTVPFPPTNSTPLEPSDRAKRDYIARRRERSIGAHAGAPGLGPLPCRITITGPVSVIEQFQLAMQISSRRGEAPWAAFERLLYDVLDDWLTIPRPRDPVFARDDWRCAVPGCTSRRNLHDHHITFRSQGGGNEQNNRITICATHHLRGIHRHLLRAQGRAPNAIHWELGKMRDPQGLIELLGHEYLRPEQVLTV